jgi:tetratricopeptide (TPR) repeat protein
MGKKVFLVVLFISFIMKLAFPDEVILKSGKSLEGIIIEENQVYIQLDIDGNKVIYWIEDIEKIEKSSGLAGDNQDQNSKNPQEIGEYISRMSAAMQRQEFTDAIRYGQELLTQDISKEQELFVLVALGVALYYLENYEKAIFYLKKGADLSPENTRFYPFLILSYWDTGQRQKAKDVFRDFLDIGKEVEFRDLLIRDLLARIINP